MRINEWEGETRRGGHYGVVRTNGNGVTKNQRTHARGEGSRVNRVPKETERGCGIHIGTINIRSGREGGLKTALGALQQGNIGIGVLQDTKLTGVIHP